MPEAFDLVLRGGTIVDGTGAEPYIGDVAVLGDRIVEVGHFAGSGREEIDARGRLVTPGFVDIHTHYDGQVTWDSHLAPSSHHGVTTVVMGNCGVGFAPCRPDQRELMIEVMEGVEDIPGVVMAEGVPFDWETFPQYLDFLEQRKCDVDFAAQVPHAPVRVYVMGKRGADREPATAADMRQMGEIVAAGIAAGALGFSTSRTLLHRTTSGALAPTITAAESELHAIASAMRGIGAGVIEMIDDFPDTTADHSSEFAMWRRLATTAERPISFQVMQFRAAPERWRYLLALLEDANREGLRMRGQVCPRPIGVLYGLDLSGHPFVQCPTYVEIAHLPLAERVALMRRPDIRAKILSEEHYNPDPRVIQFDRNVDTMYALGNPPNYLPPLEDRLDHRASALGIGIFELAYDEMLKDDGHAILYHAVTNFVDNTSGVTYELLNHPLTVLGVGDGGAHVGKICDASAPTFVLTYWTRDRVGDRIPIPAAIKMLTQDTAATVGLNDRGILSPSYKADLNVINYDALRLYTPHIAFDLPAGGRRLLQRADGYDMTIVSGVVTYRNGQSTGALPGRLVRGTQSVNQERPTERAMSTSGT